MSVCAFGGGGGRELPTPAGPMESKTDADLKSTFLHIARKGRSERGELLRSRKGRAGHPPFKPSIASQEPVRGEGDGSCRTIGSQCVHTSPFTAASFDRNPRGSLLFSPSCSGQSSPHRPALYRAAAASSQ